MTKIFTIDKNIYFIFIIYNILCVIILFNIFFNDYFYKKYSNINLILYGYELLLNYKFQSNLIKLNPN